MGKLEKTIVRLRNNPENSTFNELAAVCVAYFGPSSMTGGSHRVFRTGWPDNPRLVIQARGSNAKGYQVRQVISAIDRRTQEENHD
jgi:hypothetical protein